MSRAHEFARTGTAPATGGDRPGVSLVSVSGVVQTMGGVDYVPPVVDESHCAARKTDGTPCLARRAKGTEWCIGHLRSERAVKFMDEAIAEIDSGIHPASDP